MAAPICIGMLVQTLYFLVDLYFVGRLGDSALAGVSAAGTLMFIVMALTQMLGVSTVSLIAQAVGGKDQPQANLVFNQSLLLGLLCAALTLVLGYGFAGRYLAGIGADLATQQQGLAYLRWFIPGLALQFALNAMGSALRGTGVVKPIMLVQMVTVLVNIVLAPVLIAGWGTGHAMGVAGAGLASTLSVAVGVVIVLRYFSTREHYVGFDAGQMRPQWLVWRRMLAIGLPAGGEFAFMFVFMAAVYSVISPFGAAAMAGFGIGSRVMQAIFLPGMAIAFAVAPVAEFLGIISFNFVASGIVFACSGIFQALGNTWPSLLSTSLRLLTFVLPALWLSRQPGFHLDQVWHLSVATMVLQALVSLGLARWQLNRRAPVV